MFQQTRRKGTSLPNVCSIRNHIQLVGIDVRSAFRSSASPISSSAENQWRLAYYHDVILSQQLLPTIREVSGEFSSSSRTALPHTRARDTAKLLEQETPAFIFPRSVAIEQPPTSMQRFAWHRTMHHRQCN